MQMAIAPMRDPDRCIFMLRPATVEEVFGELRYSQKGANLTASGGSSQELETSGIYRMGSWCAKEVLALCLRHEQFCITCIQRPDSTENGALSTESAFCSCYAPWPDS